MKQKTSCYFGLPFLSSLLIFFVGYLPAETCKDYEDPFYAVSSLRYHLEEELWGDTEDSDRIEMTATDLALLWERAARSSLSKQVLKAESLFNLARTGSPSKQKKLLIKAKRKLDQVWNHLNPFFYQPIEKGFHRFVLPNDHWLKNSLDTIFLNYDAQKNHEIFEEAGFHIICKRASKMIVADHECIPGYLIKIYLLEDKPEQTWKWMSRRCEGAENVRNLIAKKNLKHFTVPDKWIYRLPDTDLYESLAFPSSLECESRTLDLVKLAHPACLVATKMNIGTSEESRKAWKEAMTHSILRELYCILSHGFASTYVHQNIPYTKEGKFTCLDTEVPFRHHKYSKIDHYLSPEMRMYWDILVKTGGKP